MTVRLAHPSERKPRVWREESALLWPWVAEVPFVANGPGQTVCIDVSVHSTWRKAVDYALTRFPDHRPVGR